jgi:hypothetical protein
MSTGHSLPHIGIAGPAMSIKRRRTSISFRQRLFFQRNQREPVRVMRVVGKPGWFARIPSSFTEFSKTVSRPASQHFRLFNRITDFRIERRKIDNLAGYEGARDLITCRLT